MKQAQDTETSLKQRNKLDLMKRVLLHSPRDWHDAKLIGNKPLLNLCASVCISKEIKHVANR